MAVSIGPNGQLGHCIVSWNGDGHSQRGDWDFDLAETWKTRSHKSDTCRACPAETVCGGPCPLEAELIGLDQQRCAFYLTTLERMLLE
jgi:radical SAM protein with 4Fe4S-binding SPASM domain